MRLRSLPALEPEIGLNLPQATHHPSHTYLFRIFLSLFSAVLAICSSAPCLCLTLTSFAPKARDGTRHVESQTVKRKRIVQERNLWLCRIRECAPIGDVPHIVLSWNAAARLARVWLLLRLPRKVPFIFA